MRRMFLILALCFSIFCNGCASLWKPSETSQKPKQKYAIDPKTGELIPYSSSSDGRTWFERHPEIPSIGLVTAAVVGAGLIGSHPKQTVEGVVGANQILNPDESSQNADVSPTGQKKK